MTKPSLLDFTVDKKSRLALMEQLNILAMPPREQRKVIMDMARAVRKQAVLNIRQQRTIDGSPMTPRKDARIRRRLLRGLGKAKVGKSKGLAVYGRGIDAAEVTYGNQGAGKIAFRHQYGIPEPWTKQKAEKVYGQPDYDKPATRAQAKSLIDAGYRVRVKRKRGKGTRLKRVSSKWIRENMTLGQAGRILRFLRDVGHSKNRWEIDTPARPFLGATPEQADAMLEDLARRTIQQIKNKRCKWQPL